jgi:2,3-bisphosphoglycerate-dependent phosphoglycerate mutase
MKSRKLNILLLRHGQTEANRTGVLQGHQPTSLNLAGVRQATLLANRLAGFRPPIDVLISSDLARAVETAGPIAAACGLRPVLDPAWRERSFGLLEGKPVGDRELWRAASGDFDPPGAEPTAKMQRRIQTAMENLIIRYPQAHLIAVVTHGGPVRRVMQMLGGGVLRLARGQTLPEVPSIHNCSILHLVARQYRDGVKWRITCVNDIAHLADVVAVSTV